MNMPCPSHVGPCPGAGNLDYDSPFANLSSERPDQLVFIGVNFGWNFNFPRLGWRWTNPNVPGWCDSPVSQEEANVCAARDNINNTVNPIGPGGSGNDGWRDQTGTRGTQVPLFSNSEQVCGVLCPDGLTFTYVVVAGRFQHTNQIMANRIAFSYACRQAAINRFCMGAIASGACEGVFFSTSLTPVGGLAPFSFAVVSGSLPPGLDLSIGPNQRTLFIEGTPTATGNYAFSLRATDARGNFMQKIYTIYVLGFTNTPTAANVNVAYSFTFTAAGGSGSFTFAVTAGALPAGLTLASDGTLSGTPTATETAAFTITATDTEGRTCAKTFSLEVTSGCPALLATVLHGLATSAGWSTTGQTTAILSPRRLWMAGGAVFNDKIRVMDLDDSTFFSTVDIAPKDAGGPGCFAIPQEKVYFAIDDSGTFRIQVMNGNTLALVTTITYPAAIGLSYGALQYDAANDRVYSITDVAGGTDCVIVNPNLDTASGFTVTQGTDATAIDLCYASVTDEIVALCVDFITPGPWLRAYDAVTQISAWNLNLFPLDASFIVYCPSNNRIYAYGVNNVSGNSECRVVNPSTGTVVATIDLSAYPSGFGYDKGDYSAGRDTVILAIGSQLVFIDPSDHSILCDVTSAPGAVQTSTFTNRIYHQPQGTVHIRVYG